MSELLDYYQQQASLRFSTTPWIRHMQENALADFARLGFPTRHQEDWKYTLVDAFLKQPFSAEHNVSENERVGGPLPLQEKHVCAINNGTVVGVEAAAKNLGLGVIIQPLAQALIEHGDKIKPYLGQILQPLHGFHALNTAMISSGLFIYLPAGVCITEPILLSHWQDKTNQAAYLRHLVIAEKGSSVTLIEDYHGDAETCYFTNTVTEAHLAAHAKLVHYKIQRESKRAFHIGQLAVKQAQGSQFTSHSVSCGGQLVRSDITIGLQEPEAQCLMNGIYIPGDGQHMDHHTVVTHEAPSCQSSQDYKGILTGHCRAVFNGRVIVLKDAQHTQATQQNKNILLSADSEIDTKPQLEIFADDVVCTHGATVGQLDEDALFYLASRGIGRAEANQYLVSAFAAENLRAFANLELATWFGTLINQQLG